MNFCNRNSLLAAIPVSALGLALASTSVQAADFTASLAASESTGIPESSISEEWMRGEGDATATLDGEEHVVEFEASGLVADGLYTIWWVNPGLVGMEMGPGGSASENQFRTDSDGSAQTTFRVPEANDYQRMVVAFHADDETHGEEPGEMGEITFEHLSGPWPGPEGEETM